MKPASVLSTGRSVKRPEALLSPPAELPLERPFLCEQRGAKSAIIVAKHSQLRDAANFVCFVVPMVDRSEPLLTRMKKLPLWQWGSICIFSALFVSMSRALMSQSSNMTRAQERASQIGTASASLLFVFVGIVLIVMHFVRRPKA